MFLFSLFVGLLIANDFWYLQARIKVLLTQVIMTGKIPLRLLTKCDRNLDWSCGQTKLNFTSTVVLLPIKVTLWNK